MKTQMTVTLICCCLTIESARSDDVSYVARVMEVNVTHDRFLAAHTTVPLSGGCVVRLDPDPYSVLPGCGESPWLGLNCMREITKEGADERTFIADPEGRSMLDLALLALLADKPVQLKITDDVKTPSGRCTALRINVQAEDGEHPSGLQAYTLD